MKHFKILALIALAVQLPSVLSAQFYNQIGVYGQGAWSSLISSAEVTPADGFRGGVGFLYEGQHGHLLINTGLGFQWRSAGVHVGRDSMMYANPLTDTQGTKFQLEVVTDSRKDYVRRAELEVPMLVGGIYGHFYFLGGLKAAIQVYGESLTRSRISTLGHYDRYVLPLTAMDSHGYRRGAGIINKGPQPPVQVFDLMASFEMGFNLAETSVVLSKEERSIREMRTRLSFFMDYSLIPLHINNPPQVMEISEQYPYDISQYSIPNVFSTERTLNSYLAGISCGVKVTVLFGNKQRFRCLNCESAVEAGINNPTSGYRAKNNRQADTTSSSKKAE